ncbi:hypothetical protein [Nostoc sp.]|uniref:hypothetical protein n=1 Tax=Nostoc sp. TaxID=1180 RepID=UPI002FF6FA0E
MDLQSIMTLAKQGDANAIAVLINNSLKEKRIIAKVAKKEDCLQIILESSQVPNQETLVSIIRKGLTSLAPKSINHVKIYARESVGSPVVWSERVSLTTTETPKTPEFSPPMSAEISQNLKKEAQKREKEISLVFWGFLIFLFGGRTIIGALSSNSTSGSGSCYDQVAEGIGDREGNKSINSSDVDRYASELTSRCR